MVVGRKLHVSGQYNKKGQKKPKRLPRVAEGGTTCHDAYFQKGYATDIPKETEETLTSPLEFYAKIQKKDDIYCPI